MVVPRFRYLPLFSTMNATPKHPGRYPKPL
jgi:hypothetical protein